jgi:prefoldin subunit 5
MSIANHLVDRAATLAARNRREDAQRLLLAALREVPDHDRAWRRYVDLWPDLEAKLAAMEQLLRVVPGHRRAQTALVGLKARAFDAAQADATRLRHTLARSRAGTRWRVSLLILLCLAFGVAALIFRLQPGKSAALEALRAEVETLDSRYAALEASYRALEADHATLTLAHRDLDARHRERVAAHETTLAAYETLETAYETLRSEHTTLQQTYASLDQSYAALQGQYDRLNEQHWALQQIAVTPPYILVQQRTVELAFRRGDGTLMDWQVPFHVLEENIRRGHKQRYGLMSLLNPRLDLSHEDGRVTRVPDFRTFIDPSPFVGVMESLYWESGDPEIFLHEAWQLIAQLSTYTEEPVETPRFPLETLLAGGGDCEDTSILLASMLKAAPVDWDIDLVYMDGQRPYNPYDVNHVIVRVDTGVAVHDIETTSPYEMEPYGTGVIGWSLDVN